MRPSPDLLQGQTLRAGTAPHQVPRQPLQPRAQSEGGPRRSSRPSGRSVARPRLRLGEYLAATGAPRLDHGGRGAPGAPSSPAAAEPPCTPALFPPGPRRPAAALVPRKTLAPPPPLPLRPPPRPRGAPASGISDHQP